MCVGLAGCLATVVLLGGPPQGYAQPAFVEQIIPIAAVPQEWTLVTDSCLASPDSTQVAYRAAMQGADPPTQMAIRNDKPVSQKGMILYGPTFSPDSKRIATTLSHHGQGWLSVDGNRVRSAEPVSAPIFSPDGQHVAYVAREEQSQFVIVDKRSQMVVYDEVANDSLTFSPDSQQFAYAARRGEYWFMIVNGQEGVGYAQVGHPVFQPRFTAPRLLGPKGPRAAG